MSTIAQQPVRLASQADDRWLSLTDAQRSQIVARRGLVDEWRRMCSAFTAADRTKALATEAFCAAHPDISQRTIYTWAAVRDNPDPTLLLDKRSMRAPASATSIGESAWDRFRNLWLTPQKRTVALCYQIVAVEALDHPGDPAWSWPSADTVRRKIAKDLPPIKADFFREGERQWDRKFGPRMRRDYSQYRSNQFWVGDFHEADVFCRRSDRDPTIVRPLVSAFTDLRSRMPVGCYVTEIENADTVLIAFRKGVLAYGAPEEIVLDNGKPYRAKGISGGKKKGERLLTDKDVNHFASVFGSLQIKPHFAIVYMPDAKPIERWFGTLACQYDATYASYCGPGKDDRFAAAYKLATKEPHLCPTVAEYAAALDRYLEAFAATPHSGSGMDGLSPREAFVRFDPVAKKVPPDGLMDLLLMRVSKPVLVTKYGVRHQGIEYGANDPRLFPIQGQKVLLRINPDDAGHVVVCALDGRPICRASNNALARTGANMENVAEGMRIRKRAKKAVQAVFEGAAIAARQSITAAAIAARIKSAEDGKCGTGILPVSKTGTDDDVPVRLSRPIHSDMADAMRRYSAQVDPPPVEDQYTFDLGAALDREDEE